MSDEINTLSVEIAKLSLRPGDVLVVKCSERIGREAADRLQSMFKERLPEGITTIILDCSLSLAVLTKEEIEARAA